MSRRKVAVIGGGWAGCAAAVELTRQGHQVALFDSARTLGGRARAVEINGCLLDNGQHILLGAYTETLRLMRVLDIDARQAFLRLPLQMRYPKTGDGMDFVASRLPAPLHLLTALLRARSLSWDDKLALARFSTTARWMGWQLHADCSVLELLARFDQTERLTRLLWRPLCIAALNTPPERASAQIFLNVLRDSLGARRAASDMLLPRVDLTALFPQRAAAFVERNGGMVRTACTVKALHPLPSGWRLEVDGEAPSLSLEHDCVIVATQPEHAATLLSKLEGAAAMPAFEYEPITTCYLQYEPSLRLPSPFLALIDDVENRAFGQFVFDRGQSHAQQAGLLAVVISASGDVIDHDRHAIVAAVAQQLAQDLAMPELQQPRWSKLITEKRATFSCQPGISRPPPESGLTGLFIAGDYIAGDYPATLESAVRSGIAAAKLVARAAI